MIRYKNSCCKSVAKVTLAAMIIFKFKKVIEQFYNKYDLIHDFEFSTIFDYIRNFIKKDLYLTLRE